MNVSVGGQDGLLDMGAMGFRANRKTHEVVQ